VSWIVLIFAASLGLALGLTPLVSKLAVHFNLVDRPTERKVHREPIPRLGGVAIYLAFSIPFIVSVVYHARIPSCHTCDATIGWLFGGGRALPSCWD
jgi:UDP-GlcNAc:undecaprenyl-phosphate GlcNAc-1-phosphate transferase